MLVTFHSDSYENITYFGDVAKQLLTLMGHSGTIPGAIKSRDLPEALHYLRQGLAKSTRSADSVNDEGELEVGLAKRAIPLLHMIEASIRDESDVLWDV